MRERGHPMLNDVTYPYGDEKDEWELYEEEQAQIAEHVRTCSKDGFCETCQSL
jgi:hypothetical protein